MKEKSTISTLARELAAKDSVISIKGWDDFLRLFFSEISRGLAEDGVVKVKGFGTFKVTSVEARKSINVQTGEDVIIPAHSKISFTPEASIAQTINKPFAHLQSYTLSPNGPVDAEEKEEEESESVNTDTSSTVEVAEEAIAASAVATTEEITDYEPIAEATEQTEEKADIQAESADDLPSTSVSTSAEDNSSSAESTEPITSTHPTAGEETSDADSKENSSKKLGIAIIIFLLVAAIAGIALYKMYPNLVSDIRDKFEQATAKSEPSVEEPMTVDLVAAQTDESSATAVDTQDDSPAAEVETTEGEPQATSAEPSTTNMPAADKHDVYAEQMQPTADDHFSSEFVSYMAERHPEMSLATKGDYKVEQIGKGDRLTLMALRNYGQKDYWIYLYLYNQDVIKNPNVVNPGTKIKVPNLSESLVGNTEQCIAVAKEVRARFTDK